MTEYRKRHIAVSPEERRRLETAKDRYEQATSPGDWGAFLTAVIAMGLAGLGLYGTAKLLQRSGKSARVACPECRHSFTVAIPRGYPGAARVVEFECPRCDAELVLDLEPEEKPPRRH